MSNPTPGPWNYWRAAVQIDGAWDYGITSGKHLIAETFGRSGETDFHDSEANAHLIAASPCLLSACKELLWLVKDSGIAECSCGKPRTDFVCLMCNAENAIRKAGSEE